MKNVIHALIFILLFCIFATAQTVKNNQQECPDITLIGPPSSVSPGEIVYFTLNGLPKMPKKGEKYSIIKWSLDKGSIISGQGTSVIGVSTDGLFQEIITITIKVDIDENCSFTLRETANIGGVGHPLAIDDFGKLETKEIKRRFALFLNELNNPLAYGYVINYGTKAEANERDTLFRNLLKETKFPDKRMIFIYGGESAGLNTKFWMMPIQCPSISITSPRVTVMPSETAIFNLGIIGDYEKDKLKIKWKVDGGKLAEGQGTKQVRILTYEKYDDAMIVTVTAKVSGFPEGCSDLEGSETYVCSHCGSVATQPIQIDDFGNLTHGNVKARIDAFIAELQNRRASQGYIVNYGSVKSIAVRKRDIIDHLNYRGYDLSRIVFVNGGFEKTIRTKFWVVPSGANPSDID